MNLKVYGKNRELWQWDTDQMLIVEGAAECQQVHFSRPGDISCPVVQIREHNGHRVADIPNLYLQQPGKFYAFLCGINGSEGQTYHREKFVIRERPRPDTYVYTQTQVLRYENLENRVAALEKHSGENNGAVKTVNGIAPDESGNVVVEGGNVDLTGYATEEWVREGYQPKGEYLTAVPDGYAKTEDIPKKPEDIGAQPAGAYLTEIPTGYATEEYVKNKIAEAELGVEEVDLSGYAQKSELPTKVSELTNDSKYITAAGAPVQSVNGKTGSVTLDASAVGARPASWMPSASDVGARPSTWTPTYTDVGADKSGAASSAVSTNNTKTDAHNDIRLLISALTTRLDALANSDDTTLDQMAEVVAYIKANRDLIEQITTGKVSVADIVNNLTTNVSNKPLSAAQGVALKALIDAITVPTKLSQLADDSTHRTVTDTEKASWNAKSNFSGNYADLSGKPTIPTVPTKVSAFTNDAGYITDYTETDPTVPSWAKASTKPSYTKSEVGLGDVDNVKQYSASNPPPYPVTSVNGKTGAVSLPTENWTFTLEDGSTVTKAVYVG